MRHYQKNAKKKRLCRNPVLTHVLTHVSEHSEHAQATHTHGLLRNALLTLLILTVFSGPCYSSYSYSRVLTGHGYSRAHTHGPLSTALLILTHTHSRLGEFSNPG